MSQTKGPARRFITALIQETPGLNPKGWPIRALAAAKHFNVGQGPSPDRERIVQGQGWDLDPRHLNYIDVEV